MKIHQLSRSTEAMTLANAYLAMVKTLEYYYGLDSGKTEVGAILGDLSSGVWADGSPGDPAACELWLKSVDEVRQMEESLKIGDESNPHRIA